MEMAITLYPSGGGQASKWAMGPTAEPVRGARSKVARAAAPQPVRRTKGAGYDERTEGRAIDSAHYIEVGLRAGADLGPLRLDHFAGWRRGGFRLRLAAGVTAENHDVDLDGGLILETAGESGFQFGRTTQLARD